MSCTAVFWLNAAAIYIAVNVLLLKWVLNEQKIIYTFVGLPWYEVVLGILLMLPIYLIVNVWLFLVNSYKKLKR